MRELLGAAGAGIIALSAAYYVLDVVRRRAQPQRTSWAIWALVGVVGFGTADAGGAGPGAWAAGADAVACGVTFLLSLHPALGKPGGRRTDLVLAAVAVAGIACWRFGALDTAGAALCAVGCDAVALWPTLREAWRRPALESLPSWAADVAGNGLCVGALAERSAASAAFPVYLLVAASAVVSVLVLRTRSERASSPARFPGHGRAGAGRGPGAGSSAVSSVGVPG
jgi:hypothetical protein